MKLLRRVRQRIGRPLRKKFNAAIPFSFGDRLVLGFLGSVLSRPGLAARTFGEDEVFAIKGALFLAGVQLHPSAYEEVGTL